MPQNRTKIAGNMSIIETGMNLLPPTHFGFLVYSLPFSRPCRPNSRSFKSLESCKILLVLRSGCALPKHPPESKIHTCNRQNTIKKS